MTTDYFSLRGNGMSTQRYKTVSKYADTWPTLFYAEAEWKTTVGGFLFRRGSKEIWDFFFFFL